MNSKDKAMLDEVKGALREFIVRVATSDSKTTSVQEVASLPEVVKAFCEGIKLSIEFIIND